MSAKHQVVYVPASLPLTVHPLAGESATSFVSRLADENGISLTAIAKAVAGKGKMPLAVWGDREWDRLATMTSLAPEHLREMRHLKAGIATCPHAVTFLGHPIRRLFLISDRIRLCPLCVGERPILREVWSLVHSVACVEHGVLLVDHCDCGRKLHRTQRGNDALSCLCGTPFKEITFRPASTEALVGSRLLIYSLGFRTVYDRSVISKSGMLPEPFASMPVADILSLIHLVGRVAATPASDDSPIARFTSSIAPAGEVRGHNDLATSITIVENAMRILQDWPNAYQVLLGEVSARNAVPIGQAQARFDLFRTRMGQLLANPPNGLDRHPIPCLREEVERFCEANGVKKRRRVPSRQSSVARRVAKIANVGQVAALVNANPGAELFTRLYIQVAKSLDNHGGDDEQVAGLLRKEVVRRWTQHGGEMSSCEASRHIGHPSNDRDMAPWVEAGLISPVKTDGSVDSKRVINERFYSDEVRALRRRIAEISPLVTDLPEGFIAHAKVSRFASHGRYPKSEMLIDIFSSAIPTVRIVEEPRLCDLYLDHRSAWRKSISHRVAASIASDSFVVTYLVNLLLDELWPNRAQKLDARRNRQIRASGIVRYKDVRNTTDGRDRPLYHYSIVDHLLRQFRLSGPSLAPEVDEQLAAVRKSRGRVGRNPTRPYV